MKKKKPCEKVADNLIKWLRSKEGKARSRQVFEKTERALKAYRDLQNPFIKQTDKQTCVHLSYLP